MSIGKRAVGSAQENIGLLTTQLKYLALSLSTAMNAFLLSHVLLIPFTLSHSRSPSAPHELNLLGPVYAVSSVKPKQRSQQDLPKQSEGTQRFSIYLSLCPTLIIAISDGGIVLRFCEEPICALIPP